jgi:L-fucose isomerase-like protein
MTATKVGFITIVRGTFDTGYGKSVRERIKEHLSRGLEVIDYSEPVATAADAAAAVRSLPMDEIGAMVVLQATFADGSVITEIAKATQRSIVVWGIPEPPAEPGVTPRLALNSLCGINLAAHSLKRINAPYACVFGSPSQETADKVIQQARAFTAVQSLRGTKLLTLGEAPQGFYPSEYDADEMQRIFGVSVVKMTLDEIFARASAVPQDDVEQAKQEVALKLAHFADVPTEHAEKSIRAYLAVKQFVDEQGVSAVAAECWPRFMTEYGGAACFTLSQLNDNGIAAACETDVFGAVTMQLQHSLTKSASFFSDLVQINDAANTGVFWHCGAAPTSLAGAAGAQAGVQPNRKVGLAMNFALKGGRVTIAKIGRSTHAYTMFLATGTAVDEPLRFLGNSLNIKFDAPVAAITETILANGLDHHYVVSYGDIVSELRQCAKALGMPVIEAGMVGDGAGAQLAREA